MAWSIASKVKQFLVMLPKLIGEFFNQANVQGSRSTVLRPLGWLLSISGAGLLWGASIGAALWIQIVFGVGVGSSLVLYLGAYAFCLAKDRDALRSETFSIQKLAIQRGFIGDSLKGALDIDERSLLNAPASKEEQE
ncbi:MAG: hypothetical protein WD696_16405 [Bryobacteraceae bacterium]